MQKPYDLLIVGGGPAGLAGAIMASSEGLTTALVEKNHLGGQSTFSPLIENVPGFPDGISGPELARVSEKQARKFGTDFLLGASVEKMDVTPTGKKVLHLASGETLSGNAALLATGMTFKDLPVPGGSQVEPRGACFNGCDVNRVKWAGKCVYVVGAANSAAQTALFLADFADCVILLCRGDHIEKGMSQYLVARIYDHPKVKVYTKTTVSAYYPGKLLVLDRDGQPEICENCDGLFVFIGSEPAPCVCDEVIRDNSGFIKCDTYRLETNIPGVFVAGDVRAGSVKRVATAYGDAVRAISNVHQYLAAKGKAA